MFGETTIFYVVFWNHQIETTIKTGGLEFQDDILNAYAENSGNDPIW